MGHSEKYFGQVLIFNYFILSYQTSDMEFLDKSNIETALSKLEKVRQLLIDAYEATKWPDTFGNQISSDYPIKSQTSHQYHSWCEIIVPRNEWTRRMNMERAKEFSVLGLTVHLKANSE